MLLLGLDAEMIETSVPFFFGLDHVPQSLACMRMLTTSKTDSVPLTLPKAIQYFLVRILLGSFNQRTLALRVAACFRSDGRFRDNLFWIHRI